MARKIIDTTTQNPGWVGDIAKIAFTKTNENFAELYDLVSTAGNNLLINPEMRINQRVFRGGALAAGAYGYDRFKAGGTGCNLSVSAAGVVTHASGTIIQVLEAPGLAGRTVCFSVEDPSGAINVQVAGVNGTINAGAGRQGVAFAIPASATGNVIVSWSVGASSTYARPKLELGSVATPFASRQIQSEFDLCQRYYQKSYDAATPARAVTDNGRIAFAMQAAPAALSLCAVRFGVRMRARPAVTVYMSEGAADPNAVTQDDGSARPASFRSIGESGFELSWSNTSNRWGGWFHYVADAEL